MLATWVLTSDRFGYALNNAGFCLTPTMSNLPQSAENPVTRYTASNQDFVVTVDPDALTLDRQSLDLDLHHVTRFGLYKCIYAQCSFLPIPPRSPSNSSGEDTRVAFEKSKYPFRRAFFTWFI